MKLVPWSQVKSWRCIGCGGCCKLTVQVTANEWLNLTRLYGPELVEQSIGGFYLRKTIGNVCPFLRRFPERFACDLQPMDIKPLACKSWPFRICDTSRYGYHDESYFKNPNGEFFVYVYPHCPGVLYGKPTEELMNKVIPEFIAIRLGQARTQIYTTSKLRHQLY